MSLPIGEIRFMSRIIDFYPRDVLQMAKVPELPVYGEFDLQVPVDQNLIRLNEIINGSSPDYLEIVVIADVQHLFRLVNSACKMYEDCKSDQPSDELVNILQNRLTERGYLDEFYIKPILISDHHTERLRYSWYHR